MIIGCNDCVIGCDGQTDFHKPHFEALVDDKVKPNQLKEVPTERDGERYSMHFLMYAPGPGMIDTTLSGKFYCNNCSTVMLHAGGGGWSSH